MSETNKASGGQTSPSSNPARMYIIAAMVLLVIIVVVAVLLVTVGLPALRGKPEPTAMTDLTPTLAPTFTPGPTKAPTNTPLPPPPPTLAIPVMLDTDTPIFDLDSAGARPSTEWTGFFGKVLDAQGNPIPDVPVIVWYADEQGIPAEPVGSAGEPIVRTDADGNYEIRLADGPFQDTWSIQVLTQDGQPASKLFTFRTDENTETGTQQIQVIWKKIP